MTAKIIDGKSIANHLKADIAEKIATRLKNHLPAPGLAVILVGNNPASNSYVRHKEKGCAEVGIISQCFRLPHDTSQDRVAEIIEQCNQNPAIHGILLQLPLPEHINADDLLERIDPKKDVDGFHPYNIGCLALRRPKLRPCTPYGVMKLLAATGVILSGKNAVVVGASNIVGRPMGLELLLAKCTVTICHRFTIDLAAQVQAADILIVAIGKPGIIDSSWIKRGSIVIDVGFNHLPDGKIVGDIEFETAKNRAEWITPVPGGVGQMTVATLLQNTLLAAEFNHS